MEPANETQEINDPNALSSEELFSLSEWPDDDCETSDMQAYTDSPAQTNMLKLKLKLEDAQKQYYRLIVRAEDRIMLKKIYEDKKELSPVEDEIFNALNFENQKLFHIRVVEENLVSCLEYKRLTKEDHISVLDSCKDILSDFDSNSERYEKLLLNLASRGVSSSYHLFQGLSLNYNKKKFTFNMGSLLKLGQVIIMKFRNNSRLKEQVRDYNYCKTNLQDYLKASQDGRLSSINIKAIKELITRTGTQLDDFIKALRECFDNLLALRNEIESNYEFLCYYYELKTHWYQSCMKRLQQMNHASEANKEMLKLFNEIQKSFIDYKTAFMNQGIDSFGPADCSFYDLNEVIYTTGKFLSSVYFCSYNVTKVREIANSIHPVESFLGIGEQQTETA
ncbi:MAG: hypothetical protein GY754_05985 [bacterium]|nr:hypothetical protein [bacterium]